MLVMSHILFHGSMNALAFETFLVNAIRSSVISMGFKLDFATIFDVYRNNQWTNSIRNCFELIQIPSHTVNFIHVHTNTCCICSVTGKHVRIARQISNLYGIALNVIVYVTLTTQPSARSYVWMSCGE